MNKNQRKSRRFSRKALERINEITQKYPSGISDIDSISEEARAWIEKKIQQTRECLKNVHFPSLPSWWETLRLSRNKTAHQTEDFTDEEFSDLSGKLFSNIKKISTDLNSNINRYHHNSKKKRKFENFASASLGAESERKQLVDAMEDMLAPIDPKDIKIIFLSLQKRLFQKFFLMTVQKNMYVLMKAFLKTSRQIFLSGCKRLNLFWKKKIHF